MGPFAATASVLGNYFTFSGRASRSEYWWWALILAIMGFLCVGLDVSVFATSTQTSEPAFTVTTVFYLFTLIPNISVLVRRLHDTDRSGWWYWIVLVPLIGAIWLLVLTLLGSTPGKNRFGPPPNSKKKFKDISEVDIPAYVPPEGSASAPDISEYYRTRVLPGQNQTEIARYDPEPDYPRD